MTLDDPRPHPHEDALSQLGHALMNEVLDVFSDTALEDFQSIVSETLIGAFHSAGQRIEREADRARDDLNRLSRDFDGSEIADTEKMCIRDSLSGIASQRLERRVHPGDPTLGIGLYDGIGHQHRDAVRPGLTLSLIHI